MRTPQTYSIKMVAAAIKRAIAEVFVEDVQAEKKKELFDLFENGSMCLGMMADPDINDDLTMGPGDRKRLEWQAEIMDALACEFDE